MECERRCVMDSILGIIGLILVPLLVYLGAKALCNVASAADAHIDYCVKEGIEDA